MRLLGDYVLLKEVTESTFTEGGFEIPVDIRELPTGKIVDISESVSRMKNEDGSPRVKIGDLCHYIAPREKGKCKYGGEEHMIAPISSVVAIL